MRYTIDLPENSHDKLSNFAKTYKLTQGDVLDVLINSIGPAQLLALAQRRDAKVSPRSLANQLLNRYSAEELQALLDARQTAKQDG